MLPADAPQMQRIHNRMLRAQIDKLNGKDFQNDEKEAFGLLREGLLSDLYEKKSSPYLNVYSDQIVWGAVPYVLMLQVVGRILRHILFLLVGM